MSKDWRSWMTVGLALAALAASAAPAGSPGGRDWPQFRGANRDGVSPETGLLKAWPEAGPREVWRRPLGAGYSSISVVGDRLYTMYAGEFEGGPVEFAAALEAATGKEIWRTRIGGNFENQFGNGPRATPTVDGDTVYVLGSVGDLAALSIVDGAKRWGLNVTETFGGTVPTFGFATSPVVDGDQLVLGVGGGEGKSYAALDKKTGETRWTFGDERPGYSSALVVDLGGKRRYVYSAGAAMHCLDAKGQELWQHPWPQGETHAMPVFVPPNRIFHSGAEGVGGKLFEITSADGKEGVRELWATPFMRNHFSSSVVHDGVLYGFDNATLKSISVEDAKLGWAKRGLGKGSLTLADGALYVLSDAGRLLLVQATPEGYVETGSVQALEGRCWTAPVLSGGRLYLRNNEEIVAYDVKG